LNFKKWLWNQVKRYDCQLESLYYYSRVMRILEEEIFIVNAITPGKGVAIDVGANYGIWSYHLSKLFANVEAFEPIWECCDVIRNTHRKNINVHNEALSSSCGSLEVKIQKESNRLLLQPTKLNCADEQSERITVVAKTLDDCAFSDVSFIRINVAGHELEVLKGAENTIKRDKPVMIVEIEQRHLDFLMSRVFERMSTLGYSAYFLSGRRLRPYSEFSYERDQMPYLNNLTSIFYVDSFIFIPV
jgi:FkbM family methyltransferase